LVIKFSFFANQFL